MLKPAAPKTKINQDCGYFYTGTAHYSYSYGYSCGVNCSEIVVVWQREYMWFCFDAGNGGGAGEAYPYETSAPD